MAADLAHVNAGYIQEQETDFKRAIDRLVAQKMGKNLNYLKDQADASQALAASIFSESYKCKFVTVPVTLTAFGLYSGIAYDGPVNNPILFVSCMSNPGDYRTPYPVICFGPQVGQNIYGSNGSVKPPNGIFAPTIFSRITFEIVGPNRNQIYVTVNPNSGPMPPAPHSGSFRFSIIYKVDF